MEDDYFDVDAYVDEFEEYEQESFVFDGLDTSEIEDKD